MPHKLSTNVESLYVNDSLKADFRCNTEQLTNFWTWAKIRA